MGYIRLDNNTGWPHDDDDLQHKLRYGGQLTRSERLRTASILQAWAVTIDPHTPLNPTITNIRAVRRELKAKEHTP